MIIKKIYITFEGVVADFDDRLEELSLDAESFYYKESRLWERIQTEKHFCEGLKPLPGSLEMVKTLHETYKNTCEIVSERYCSDLVHNTFAGETVYAGRVYEIDHKTAWVQKYLPFDIKTNWEFKSWADYHDAVSVLIDCRKDKINKWQETGGIGILFESPQDTYEKLRDIEEALGRENRKILDGKLEQSLKKCKEDSARIESENKEGVITDKDARSAKARVAIAAMKEIENFCKSEEIDVGDNERDKAFQRLFASVGISIRKVPIRRYPMMEMKMGSIYSFMGAKDVESLYFDENPVGKTFKFQIQQKMGIEKIFIDYYFKVEEEEVRDGWTCYNGTGLLRGYGCRKGGSSINIRNYCGKIQSVIWQKTYVNHFDPIWKRRSVYPIDDVDWIGIYEDIPEDLVIPEGEFYYDAVQDPPLGIYYKEQGILAYADTDEIVILGILDYEAEIVEIPCEINGKPVTALDERCFANCRENLRKVILPDTLKEIGDNAFMGCAKLEKPEIPPSVTKIGKNVF